MTYHSEMTTGALIARGRELTAEIAAAERELKEIEAELRKRALAMPHAPLADGRREGRRAVLRDGAERLPVVFESDLLRASWDAASDTARRIREMLVPGEWDGLFRERRTVERLVKDGHKFRQAAAELLGPARAAALVDLVKDRDRDGIVKSKVSVEWKAEL